GKHDVCHPPSRTHHDHSLPPFRRRRAGVLHPRRLRRRHRAGQSRQRQAGAGACQIAVKQWRNAIDELKRINDTGSADWNNLMGYSLRKGKTPDLDGAEKFYNEALRIDPKHRGALEYSGELYLM